MNARTTKTLIFTAWGELSTFAAPAAVEIPGDKVPLHGTGAFKGSLFLEFYDEDINSVFAVVEFAYSLKSAYILPVSFGNILPLISKGGFFNMV